MTHQETTTYAVGEQPDYVRAMPTSFDGMGAVAHQPCFAPVTRRDLLVAVNTAARDLGLRAASVVVMDALLSCLPCRDARTGTELPVTPLTLLTIYAANSTLCFRAKGITERQLRRHLERLEELGLIRRRDSANGKRFPIKRDGQVIGAFGIDLSPLLARSGEILALARKRREQDEELRGLKARIQKLRLQCLQIRLDEWAQTFVEGAQTLLRRTTTTVAQAHAILDRLQQILAGPGLSPEDEITSELAAVNAPAERLVQGDHGLSDCRMSATDGQNDRHIEPQKSNTQNKAREPLKRFWTELGTLPQFYPDMPRSEHGMLRVIFEFGKMLGIRQNTLTQALQTMGLQATLAAQDRMAAKAESIANPDGYLARIISAFRHPVVGRAQNAGFA